MVAIDFILKFTLKILLKINILWPNLKQIFKIQIGLSKLIN